MALQQTNHLCQDLLIAIKLYRNNQFSPCLIHINDYLKKNVSNVVAYDIKGTCLIKLHKLQDALQSCKFASQADPYNLAVINNIAYILIELGKYSQAFSMLQQLSIKWNHPTIYENLKRIAVLTNNTEYSSLAQEKIQNTKIIYPKVFAFQDGLILNFILDPNTTFLQSNILENDLSAKIRQLHSQPISTKQFSNLMNELTTIIQELRNLQFKYGIIRRNDILIGSKLIQTYLKIMKRIWLDIEHKIQKQIYQHYHSQINEISNKVEKIFWHHYQSIKETNTSQENQKIKSNFNNQIANLNNNSLHLNELIQKDRTFLRLQNHQKKVKLPKRVNFDYLIKKDLTQFQQVVQKFKTKHEFWISFQKGQTDPFFVIVKPIIQSQNQQAEQNKNGDDQLIVYLNFRKCLQRFDMSSQCRQSINRLENQQTKRKLMYFYWSITFLSKIYTWYSEGSLQISRTTQKAKLKYYLSITQLIQLVHPLLEEIPKDQVQGIGQIVRTLHYNLIMFFTQCRNGPGDPLKNYMIENITKCLSNNQNEISNLMAEIISIPSYLQVFLQLQKQVATDYIKWRILLNLPNKYQSEDKCVLLTNCMVFFINFGFFENDDAQPKNLFIQNFVRTFIQTTRESGKKQIIEQFYQKHHQKNIFKKGLDWLKWIFL